ncbi:MoaD/ThiS family protein [Uliginosibacterium sp. H3]|uniref:MoaD/ThiS family protein n=1 Tax=Uliginosibacterium silvisoli TaxID=3114758 RepID=A0ABU6JZ06_9RHOO|nr:MoaD/ThiS family protein [Uliginosibacterium sp. H3]
MARIVLTQQLQRFTYVPEVEAPAENLREALEASFAENPQLRGYVLDEQGHVRKHVAVFVDGKMIRDRKDLSHPLAPTSEVYVLQALSGG